MRSASEPVLHALSVEPAVARPGDTVRVTFRTRNVGMLSSPPGTVAFTLPDGLEALGPAELPLPQVEPGEPLTVTLCARVLPPFDDRAELPLYADLLLAESRLATNVCLLRVRSRAVLDGASSGIFVEPSDAATVRIRAVVTNEGDGPAVGVHVRVPPPAGCRRLDGDGDATLDTARLEVGDSLTLDFDARIEHVMREVRADGAEVRFGTAMRRALPVRCAVALQPVIAPPQLSALPLRRCAEVTVELRNDGWAHAHDVCVRITAPKGLRLAERSVEIDGVLVAAAGRARRGTTTAIARLQRRSGTHAVVISLLPARSTTRLGFTLHHAGDCDGGTIEVCTDEHVAELEYRAEPVRDVRIEPLCVPSIVAPGATATIRVRVVNAGDRAERLGIGLIRGGVMEALPLERTLEPSACSDVDLSLPVGASCGDEGRLPFAVIVTDANGERARAELAVVVRAPVAAATDPDDDVETAVERAAPAVHAALRSADDAIAGAPLALRLDVDVEDFVERLTIRVAEQAGVRYLAGSTSVGGCTILDGIGGSPLRGDGLVVRAVPPGTRVAIGWSALVDAVASERVTIAVELDVDGHASDTEPLVVPVRQAGAFATRPPELAYHVDACALSRAIEPRATRTEPVVEDDVAPAAVKRKVDCAPPRVVDGVVNAVLDGEDESARATERRPLEWTPRWDEIARLLNGARCGGLVQHVLALRAFFPEPQTIAGGREDAALDAVGDALRDVFDRLFVKLRIPGFVVAADDLEDRRLRDALLALADPGGTNACSAALADAPLGAPLVLRTLLVAIPPPACDAPLDAAAGSYLGALDAALAEYEGLPLELFDDALARGRDAALAVARETLLVLIDEQLAPRPIAC